jgi:hypothetical protein
LDLEPPILVKYWKNDSNGTINMIAGEGSPRLLYTLNHAIYIYYGQEKLPPLGNCSKLGFQPVAIARFSLDTSSVLAAN